MLCLGSERQRREVTPIVMFYRSHRTREVVVSTGALLPSLRSSPSHQEREQNLWGAWGHAPNQERSWSSPGARDGRAIRGVAREGFHCYILRSRGMFPLRGEKTLTKVRLPTQRKQVLLCYLVRVRTQGCSSSQKQLFPSLFHFSIPAKSACSQTSHKIRQDKGRGFESLHLALGFNLCLQLWPNPSTTSSTSDAWFSEAPHPPASPPSYV